MPRPILYNSQDPACKRPFGALQAGVCAYFCLRVPEEYGSAQAFLCLFPDGGCATDHRMEASPADPEGYLCYSLFLTAPAPGLWYYHFALADAGGGRHAVLRQNGGCALDEGDCWQLSVYSRDYEPPALPEGAVFYQIFPDRFCKVGSPDLTDKLSPYTVHADTSEVPVYLPGSSGKIENNDFYGGNFRGIEHKLPYLKSLGVDAVYLNPICMAWSNHRYDTADYMRPDPMLGTEEDFSALCRSAHGLGIRIILDGVFSHTGSRSVYFDALGEFGGGAVSAGKSSPYFDWYRFRRFPDDYECWWDVLTLPCVEETAPSYLEHVLRGPDCVVAHWLRLGADGFRLDVADELPDSFIAELRERIRREKPGALLIGEVWEDASDKISYGHRRNYLWGEELDGVMNYPFRTAVLNYACGGAEEDLARAVMSICENYPAPMLNRCLNSLSTHDTERVFTHLGGLKFATRQERAEALIWGDHYETTLERLRVAVFLQFVLPGCPCIYYGDEAGLQGYEDPFNRRFFPWGHEDPRTLGLHRALSSLRHSHPALMRGTCRITLAQDGRLCLLREWEETRLAACINRREDAVVRGRLLFGEHAQQQDEEVYIQRGGFALICPAEPDFCGF